jgi:type II secretory pathway pseudopilin PulG
LKPRHLYPAQDEADVADSQQQQQQQQQQQHDHQEQQQQQQQQQQHQEQHQRSPPHELSPSSHPQQEEKLFSEPSGQQLQHEEVLVEYVSLPADRSEAARLPTAAEGASASNVQLASTAAVVAASRDSSHTDAFGNLTVGAQSTTAVAAAIETTKALLRKIEVKGAGNLVGGWPHAQAQPAASSLDMLEVRCCALALASAASFQSLFDPLAVCSPPTPCYCMGQSITRQLATNLRFFAAPKQQVVRNRQHA